MGDQKDQEDFELRSEKVRNIVGQIPSLLLRYGIAIICIVFCCVIAVAHYLPYKEVYLGTAVVRERNIPAGMDSLDVLVLLRFDGKRLDQAIDQPLSLISESRSISGTLIRLSAGRDTLERQVALCRFLSADFLVIENQSFDFRITRSSGSILSHMFGCWETDSLSQ